MNIAYQFYEIRITCPRIYIASSTRQVTCPLVELLAEVKSFKFRDKHVELLKKELKKIHARSTLLYIRRSVRKANKSLNEVVDFIERYDSGKIFLRTWIPGSFCIVVALNFRPDVNFNNFSDLLAVKSVKCKNIYLARALQNEKERSNRLLQEKIEIQSAYHDALREKAEIKVISYLNMVKVRWF